MTRIATDGIARNHSYNLWHFAVLRDLILIAQKIYKIPYTSNTDGIIRDHIRVICGILLSMLIRVHSPLSPSQVSSASPSAQQRILQTSA